MPEISRAPSILEQQMLEYLNRMRLDPAGEFDRLILSEATSQAATAEITNAIRFFGTSVSAFCTQMESFSPVAPLAWNDALALAARRHNDLMIAQDTQSHQLPGEPGLRDRLINAGYTGFTWISENVFAFAEDPLYAHAGFVIDWGYDTEDFSNGQLLTNWNRLGDGIQDPPGHLLNMMNPNLREVGMGMVAESNSATNVGDYVITQNFGARSNTSAFLMGVVIDDANSNRFYDMGEGLGGVSVTVRGGGTTLTTTTWDSGGYQIALAPGSYTVTFSGNGLAQAIVQSVTIGAQNVKLDAFCWRRSCS